MTYPHSELYPVLERAGLVPDDWTTGSYPAPTETGRTADFYLEGAGEPTTLTIDSNGNAMLAVTLPPMSFTWYVVTETGTSPAAPPAKPLALRQLLNPLDTELGGTVIGSGTAEANGLAFDGGYRHLLRWFRRNRLCGSRPGRGECQDNTQYPSPFELGADIAARLERRQDTGFQRQHGLGRSAQVEHRPVRWLE